ncbi:MAG: Glu-tRNA(Gln) amidotransferase GatDE subunit D, partial [Nanoarchaeota archaeon]
HTTRRDAFKAINALPIARVSVDGKIHFLDKQAYQPPKGAKLNPAIKMEEKVAIIRTYPNFCPDLINLLSEKGYKGCVFEVTGLGQAPTNIKDNLLNYEALKRFIQTGGIVLLTSQCIHGRVHPHVYTNCRRLARIGVIFAEDMITETAYIKLAWLLGNQPKKTSSLLTKNLRGEINERTQVDYYP